MINSLFLAPLLTSFATAAAILMALIFLNKKKKLFDERIGDRHIGKNGISRFGGVALIVSFIFAVLIDDKLIVDPRLLGVLIAIVFILIFGIFDDIKQISWKWQLLFQIAIVVFVYFIGIRLEFISNPFGGIFLFEGLFGYLASFVISIVWIVFLTNAINWVDGIDGVAGGISVVGMIAIFLLSLRPEVNQPPIAIIACAILGGLAAFLIFNFHPAKIIAGTSGSMFMGFMLAILAIFAGAKMATTLLVLTVPIVDALWVVFWRLKSGDSIFSADKKHLHFRLLDLGWSQKQICFFYYTITALVSVIALNTHALGKMIAFLFFGILTLGILFFINKKTVAAS